METDFKKGFTLVELLVVVAIIVTIVSIVTSFLSSASMRSRDGRRKQNVDQTVKAISLFFNENGYLPLNETGWCTYISNPESGYGAAFQLAITPHMKLIQFDPTKAGQVGDYLYKNVDNINGHFVFCANMEVSTGNSYDHSSCLGGTTYNYCVIQ